MEIKQQTVLKGVTRIDYRSLLRLPMASRRRHESVRLGYIRVTAVGKCGECESAGQIMTAGVGEERMAICFMLGLAFLARVSGLMMQC